MPHAHVLGTPYIKHVITYRSPNPEKQPHTLQLIVWSSRAEFQVDANLPAKLDNQWCAWVAGLVAKELDEHFEVIDVAHLAVELRAYAHKALSELAKGSTRASILTEV